MSRVYKEPSLPVEEALRLGPEGTLSMLRLGGMIQIPPGSIVYCKRIQYIVVEHPKTGSTVIRYTFDGHNSIEVFTTCNVFIDVVGIDELFFNNVLWFQW